ncbi:armadillo-type protein [Cunninghamella echinulata]|nr:armadillo-type protein [Cunninghamella echinulata]
MSHDSRGFRSRNEGRRFGGNNREHRGGNRFRDDRRKRNYYQSSSRDDEMEDIQERLRGLIIKIGDKITPDLQVNLNKMKNILDSDFDKYPDMVQDTLLACVLELPAKAPIYGSLIGLLNVSNHSIVVKLMEKFNDVLKETVEKLDWFKLKQLVRFYGELVNANVISPSAYCYLLEDILTDLNQIDQLKRRLDCLVYIVLSSLPWSGKELSDRCSSDLNAILSKIDIYMTKRGSTELPVLKVFQDAKDQDELIHLWQLIQNLQKNDWKFSIIPKVYRWFDDELNSALQHEIPRLTIRPSEDVSQCLYPKHILKVFVDESGKTRETLPDHDSLEYFVLQDIISGTVRIFESNRKDCAKYLFNIAGEFEPGYFSFENEDDNDDKMKEDSLGWNASEILMESLLSEMLTLPTAPYRLIFFSTLMAEMVRLDTRTFPLALGRTVKLLFERLPSMDVECISRLWTWFSHHLSNFGFQWDWVAWEDSLTFEPLHPQVCFIRETLEKEIRLSYYERIKTSLPENFTSLIPTQTPGPNYGYADANNALYLPAKQIVDHLRAKKSVEEVRESLEKIKQDLGNQGMDEKKQSSTVHDLFIQSLLHVGAKSFSHILNVIERYLEIMRHFNSTQEDKLCTIRIVAFFWKNNSQFLGILLDKLLNYRILDPSSVILWVFESNQMDNPGRSYVWEILKNTINKVVSRATQIKNRLENFQQLHSENEAKRAANPVDELAKAEAQQELDTIQIAEKSLATVNREQKEVFILVYQQFSKCIQSLLTKLSNESRNPDEDWTYWWISGWFKEFLRAYHKECSQFQVTLETIVFTSDLDSYIINVFEQVNDINKDIKAEI